MVRYARTLYACWSAALAAEVEYRLNFAAAAVIALFTLIGSLLVLAIFYGPDTGADATILGGWTYYEALCVTAVYTLLDGFQQTFLQPNRQQLTEMVREGQLDFVLIKPIDPQFWLSTNRLAIFGVPNLVFGGVLLVFAMSQLDALPSAFAVALGLSAIVVGMAIVYALGFLLATLTIWFVKMDNITLAMNALLEAGRYPIPAYAPAYRVFFTFVLPVAFMTTVPAATLTGRDAPGWALAIAFGIAAAMVLGSRLLLKFALRFYTSASS
ncbi:MAG: ABC-2 family transporter protein [Planctomycetota bacterium]